ncbi:MAG: hypothetical protein MSA50_07165 [Veillonellaceae bacterium]|nr:hypothetical protein [Veillonellaceae bacterium]
MSKRFVIALLCLMFLPVYSVVGYNVWNDTSGLFNTDFSSPRSVEPNQHFIKMRYLLANPDKYDAYCFGTSRIANIDLTKIKDGHRYYNMTYSMGLPAEWLNDLRIMLHHHVSVHCVILGLDDVDFLVDPASHNTDLLRIPYRENNFSTYMAYLFRNPKAPQIGYNPYYASIYDIYDSGRTLHEAPDQRIEADLDAHRKKVAEIQVSPNDLSRRYQALAEIQEIKNLCESNGIKLIVFISPHEHKLYQAMDLDRFREIQYRLAQITPYYDFSGLNRITTDDYYYYEVSHYRPIVGDMIIHRIFDMPKEADTDFGKYVEQTF